MHQQIQVPPYWNNEIDHLSKSSHLIEAKRAIDTSLPVSKEWNTERQGLRNEWKCIQCTIKWKCFGPWPGIICQLDLFQRPKFNQLGFFFFFPLFFCKSHLFQPSERKRFPFNGKSVFDCKDGTLRPWPGCSYPPNTPWLFSIWPSPTHPSRVLSLNVGLSKDQGCSAWPLCPSLPQHSENCTGNQPPIPIPQL